jgi:hypothetical protein
VTPPQSDLGLLTIGWNNCVRVYRRFYAIARPSTQPTNTILAIK